MSRRDWVLTIVAVAVLIPSGFYIWRQLKPKTSANSSRYGTIRPEDIQFSDDVTANAEFGDEALDLTFTAADGRRVSLSEFRGSKPVVLVFMRGTSGGELCPYCNAQTSRLIANHDEFVRRDAEVLVVYPGPKDRLDDFIRWSLETAKKPGAKVPFPVLLDEDLAAVDKLEIRADLAKPATLIIDKQGQLRFAYVGAHREDRPSLKAILAQLDKLGS